MIEHKSDCIRSGRKSAKPLAAFCFIPSPPAPSRIPHIMCVAKDGALEILPVRDSLNHRWNARGDLSVADYGRLRVRSSTLPSDAATPPEPWEISIESQTIPPDVPTLAPPTKHPQLRPEWHRGRSSSAQRLHDIEFPPLPAAAGSSLTATRPNRQARTYSPSSMRRVPAKVHGAASPKTPSSASPRSSPRLNSKLLLSPGPTKGERRGRSSAANVYLNRTPSDDGDLFNIPVNANASASLGERATAHMQQDISMVMRRRTQRGYGLENVRMQYPNPSKDA